jgi:hypothetical protein
MPDPQPTTVQVRNAQSWTNASGNVQVASVAAQYDLYNGDASAPPDWKTGLSNLVWAVKQAESAGKRVRPVGAAWSMSPVAATTDYLVNTVYLNQVFAPFAASDVQSGVDPSRLVHAQGGARVADVHTALRQRGQSLRTTGGSDGQTIAGALSTGSHGSAPTYSGLGDEVRALHLVSEGGQTWWLERASQPILADSVPASLGATVRRDDALFNAAIVGLGAFGLIHSVVLETTPLFYLRRYREKVSVDDGLLQALYALDFSKLQMPQAGTPYHFEVVINPYAVGATDQGAYVTTCYPVQNPNPPPAGNPPYMLGDDFGALLGPLLNAAPGLVPNVLPGLLDSQYAAPTTDGTLGDLFHTSIGARYAALSCELGINVGDAENALNVLAAAVQTQRANGFAYPGLLAFRFSAKARASLALNQFDPTCTIEMPSLGGVAGTPAFYADAWQNLGQSNIPYTLHFGQVNQADAGVIQRMYGTSAAAWLAARRSFLSVAGRKTFSNDFLDACGLSS